MFQFIVATFAWSRLSQVYTKQMSNTWPLLLYLFHLYRILLENKYISAFIIKIELYLLVILHIQCIFLTLFLYIVLHAVNLIFLNFLPASCWKFGNT